jgi:phosphoglycolate phosphatase
MHLIFDLDGTLIDSRDGILFSLRQAIKQVFPASHPESLEFIIAAPVRVMLQRTFQGATKKELDDLEAAFRASYDNEGWKMTRLFPGVLETLKEFQALNIPLYIITNKPSFSTRQILFSLNIASLFLEVVSPDSRKPKFKEKTESFCYLLNKYKIPHDKANYVGDSMEDLFTAEAFSVPFIGIEYGYGSFQELHRPIHSVHIFPELLNVVSTWTHTLASPLIKEKND